ncbi:MAG: GrpB family protein [Rhodospirillaceae bacterium]|nr:GrpB family protein [Rhodospirillaceae bacterium]
MPLTPVIVAVSSPAEAGTSGPEVVLTPHHPYWGLRAGDEIGRLAAALGDLFVAAAHVGSTAVPGLRARPSLDLAVVVPDLAALDAHADTVGALGYVWRGEHGVAGRRYATFDHQRTLARMFNVQFVAPDSALLERLLALRDYLRAMPGEAAAYDQIKSAAAAAHPHDVAAYAAAKSAWLEACEARALAWRHGEAAAKAG